MSEKSPGMRRFPALFTRRRQSWPLPGPLELHRMERMRKTAPIGHSDDVDQSFRFDADQIGAKRRRPLSV